MFQQTHVRKQNTNVKKREFHGKVSKRLQEETIVGTVISDMGKLEETVAKHTHSTIGQLVGFLGGILLTPTAMLAGAIVDRVEQRVTKKPAICRMKDINVVVPLPYVVQSCENRFYRKIVGRMGVTVEGKARRLTKAELLGDWQYRKAGTTRKEPTKFRELLVTGYRVVRMGLSWLNKTISELVMGLVQATRGATTVSKQVLSHMYRVLRRKNAERWERKQQMYDRRLDAEGRHKYRKWFDTRTTRARGYVPVHPAQAERAFRSIMQTERQQPPSYASSSQRLRSRLMRPSGRDLRKTLLETLFPG